MQQHNALFLRKRKFLIFLPLIAIPLLTLLVWALGMSHAGVRQSPVSGHGLNVLLPGPDTSTTGPGDKMSLYLKAEKDSLERARIAGLDTLFDRSVSGNLTLPVYKSDSQPSFMSNGINKNQPQISVIQRSEDPNEIIIRQKLNILNHELNKVTTPPSPNSNAITDNEAVNLTMTRRENMLQQNPEVGEIDTQMRQVKEVLEKIMDVQNPELVKERIKSASLKNKERVYLLSTGQQDEVCELISRGHKFIGIDTSDKGCCENSKVLKTSSKASKIWGNKFYESEDESVNMPEANAATAVVHSTQVVLAGSTLKMRITQDVYVQGVLIPNGTPVYGECRLDGERLNIIISAIRYGEGRYAVNLTVYDYDGLPGIRIHDAIPRQTTAQGADQALQSLQLYSMDPSVAAQAATAGAETVKNILSKKIKQIKTTVKADYPILLVDNSQHH